MAGYNEKRLLHDLLDTYNTLERPVVNESDPLQISFGLTLMQIIDVDEKNQMLVTNIWLKLVSSTDNQHTYTLPQIEIDSINDKHIFHF